MADVLECTLTYKMFTNKSGTEGDSGREVALVGRVRVVPQTTNRKPFLDPASNTGWIPREFVGYIGEDGILRETEDGDEGLKVWANDPILNLSELWYKVDFEMVDMLTRREVQVGGGYFEAPSGAVVVQLAAVLQPSGSHVTGSMRSITYAEDIPDFNDAVAATLEASVQPAVDSAINAIIDGAPGALNTLNELAAAMGDDANFAANIATSLMGKLDKTGLTNRIYATDGSGGQSALPYSTVASSANSIVMRDGNARIKAAAPSASDDLTPKAYVDTAVATKQTKFMTGTSGTAAATTAKTVTLDAPWASYVPVVGDYFEITFTSGQQASGPTLAINGSTARAVIPPGGAGDAINTWMFAGAPVLLRFTGTYYMLIGATSNNIPAEISSVNVINTTDATLASITGRRAEVLMANEATKTRTLTGKTIDGVSNTLTNIPVGAVPALTEAVQDIVGAMLVQGSNVDILYNDAANTITISSTGGGGGGGGPTNLTITLSATNATINSDTGTDAIVPAVDGTNAGVMTPAMLTTLNDLVTQVAARVPTSRTINGAALSANVTLTQDNIGDGTTNKAFTATEKTKLAGIAAAATANSSDASLLARANHTGTQSADTVIDGTTNKAFTAVEKTKLGTIAAAATANSADATLVARANHTGTQASTTISDFTEAVQDVMGTTLVQGSNVTLTYNDAANTLTVAAAASTGFTLNPRASIVTASATLVAGDYAVVDSTGAGSAIVLTFPSAPADGTLIGIYLSGVTRTVTISRSGSDEFVFDGSGLNAMTIYDANNWVGLSVWRYETTGAFWHLITYNTLPRSSEIVDASAVGRSVLTAASPSAIRDNIEVWKKRVNSAASAATITPNVDTTDHLNVINLAINTTFLAPLGTPVDGQEFRLRIRDNGTLRTLAYNAIWRAVGVTLPTSTTVGKLIVIDFVYNAFDAVWDAVDVRVQA